MNNRMMANLLKLLTAFLGLLGLVFFLLIAPMMIEEMTKVFQLAQGYGNLLKGMMIAAAVMIYAALFIFWRIVGRIGQNHSFCRDNAEGLKRIGMLAAVDTAICFAAAILLLVLNCLHPVILFLAAAVILIGCTISVAAFTLSYLVRIAERIQQENELMV